MEQVRELLFGAQLKDMEIRFKRQEERFLREIADARDSLKNRLDSLENFMKSENNSILNRLKEEREERGEALRSEQKERGDALAQVARDLAGASENLERKIAKVASSLETAERDLRQLLQNESTSLSGKTEEKYQDALNVISSTSEQIRHDMAYRSSLSSLFTEVAVKLSGQWTPEMDRILAAPDASNSPGDEENGPGAEDA